MRRLSIKSVVKFCGSTTSVPLKLLDLSADEAGGMYYVAVKCIDIIQNPDSEGSLPDCN